MGTTNRFPVSNILIFHFDIAHQKTYIIYIMNDRNPPFVF
jgi:hypothetical protein